jgi:predicted DNA-binding transcriptional regulator AlpA
VIRPDDLLDTDEVAGLLGVTRQSLVVMRARPERHPRIASLPPPLRTISGRPVWARADIEAWLAR